MSDKWTVLHQPVLQHEVISFLQPKPGGKYLDGTVGIGGHAYGLLHASGDKAELCGIDRDEKALAYASERLKCFGQRVHLYHKQYSQFSSVLDSMGWDTLDGALIDIGVSSLQIDSCERGFSFYHDGPLDMRMDQRSDKKTVEHLVNTESQTNLYNIIAQYGEDPQAKRIAKAIVQARVCKKITTTKELADIVEQAYPASWRSKARNHPATRTFQAFRMVVNEELEELTSFLENILPRMAIGGRVAVITFHSLEDRIVKRSMKSWVQGICAPLSTMEASSQAKAYAKIITIKPLAPSSEEITKNLRSRSAKLRVAERCLPDSTHLLSSKEKYDLKKSKKARSG